MRIRNRVAAAVLTGALALAGVACTGDDAGTGTDTGATTDPLGGAATDAAVPAPTGS